MKEDILNRGYDALAKEFKKPGNDFRGKPFWSWNGELEEEELKRQVDVMKEMGFGGYFMHSRCGLITEYLGEEWFKLVNAVTEKGKEANMESWLYDEDRWPSGSAGGIVTKDPKYRMKSIYVYESKDTEPMENMKAMFEAVIKENGDLKAFKKLEPNGKITLKAENGDKVKVLKFAVVPNSCSSSYNGTTYIDTMMKEATEKFIEVTHEKYKSHATKEIWNEIRGIFTDEPHRGKCFSDKHVDEEGYMSCPIFYTNDIFEEFQKRYGYDALEILPELYYDAPDFPEAMSLKHDYIDLGCNLFNERFAMPINKWCNENGIEFTGHVLHEDSLMAQTAPNGSLMRFYANMAVPGIDNLCNGNDCYWAAKQLQSAARQLGKKQMLSELYGCTGWNFDFSNHKSVGDWQALYGINLRCPHLSWYTMEGEAKRDYPASILHQATYYHDYAYVEDYFARFASLMAEGRPACDTLVINPIESVWIYAHTGWANWIFSNDPRTRALENHYVELFFLLQNNHVDFDYADEQMFRDMASVAIEDGKPILKVGEMKYKTVVISGSTTIRSSTISVLRAFAMMGGKVVILGDAPTLLDCKPNNDIADGFILAPFTDEGVIENVKANEDISITLEGKDAKKMLCQMRYLDSEDAFLVALLNTDRREGKKDIKVTLKGLKYKAIEEWCLENGERYKVDSIDTLDFEISGERMFVLRKTKGEKLPKKPDLNAKPSRQGEITGPFKYDLGEKNVMVLDIVKGDFVSADGKEHHFDDEVLQVDMKIRDAVGIEHRSGDSLQPWYIKKFVDKEYGKLTLTYDFNIEKLPETDILLAGERPEFITYYVNGTELKPDGKFWTDVAFKTMPIDRKLLKKGKNQIVGVTTFKQSTNVEAVYLVGDFGVKSECLERRVCRKPEAWGIRYSLEKTTMTTLPKTVTTRDLMDQNLLFYTGTIAYKVTPKMIKEAIGATKLKRGEKLVLETKDFVGSLVKVTDNNGENKKIIGWAPYAVDVTEFAKKGFEVVLVPTRKNVFGPLHATIALTGAVGPDHFKVGGEGFRRDFSLVENSLGKITLKVI